MKNRASFPYCVAVASMVGALVLFTETTASAQRWGRSSVPRAGACFFRDANFQNDYFCVQAGQEIPDLPNGMNNEISSIRTFGNVEVTIFQNDGFGGRSKRFATDVRNLQEQDWNDRLSSIRVGGRFDDVRGGQGGYGDVRSVREADRIIERAYREILRRDPDPEGRREYRNRLLNDNWTEAELRQALRTSQERQDRVTTTRSRTSRARAEQIVRDAYLSVLNREPDSGSGAYVDKVLNEGWSAQDVTRALRNSEEFRNNHRRR
jgi:hypothetical protein